MAFWKHKTKHDHEIAEMDLLNVEKTQPDGQNMDGQRATLIL